VTASGTTRLAGVMGWPVSHSLSPRLHGCWLERHGIDGAYLPLPVAPEHFAQALRVLSQLGFAGVNVTIPHKESALDAIDEASALASRIGAVNTVIRRDDGSLYGENTDGYGFLENLRAAAPAWRADAGPAVVLGAGGAARAVVVALLDAGAPAVRLVNRTLERAEALAEAVEGPVSVVSWVGREDALAGAALLVNTTALGMDGKAPLVLALDSLPAHAVVNDLVYAPLETPLLAAARQAGHIGVDGLGMLLHQARPGFAAWFGVEPEVDDALRAFVLAGRDAAR
jgi:shikimate dehydrogenase